MINNTIYQSFGKRIFDFVVAALLLIIATPLLVVVSLCVLATMGRPIIFRQVRPGKDEKLFSLYKFRTMRHECDSTGATLTDAARLTPFGKLLRETSIDELPELINVLRGDMSLVGPRPLLPQYLDRYTPQQRRRHLVRPGLTGLAQVSGRNAIAWDRKLSLDLEYVENISFQRDVSILLQTICAVLTRQGITSQGEATTSEFLGPTVSSHETEASKSSRQSQDWAERWPDYDFEVLAEVAKVLESGKVNYWTGQQGRLFEQEYAKHLGVAHAVSVANGTVALELALAALGIGPGDEVVVPSRTFIATASAVVACGATPIVADIDAESQNLNVSTINRAISKKTRAIIAVHLGGWPCDMGPIMELANALGIWVIEDCAQAHGGAYYGRPVGSLGHISAFSFCQDKIISTGGEGGLVATNDPDLWAKVWSRKDHGKNYNQATASGAAGSFRFLHDEFGTNARMTEMQAAIGRVQLRRLADWHHRRTSNARSLVRQLSGTPGLSFPTCPAHFRHAYYRLYGFLDTDRLAPGWTRDRVLAELTGLGVPVGCGSCGEIYRERAFTTLGLEAHCPIGRRLHSTSLAFCVHPTLSGSSIDRIAQLSRDVLARAFDNATGRRMAA